MMGLLLLLLVQQDRISELLDQLGNDSVEVRDRASADLRAGGEAVRDALEGRLRKATDPEVQVRIQELLRRLDLARSRKEFQGGKVIDDLGVRLTLTHEKEAQKLSLTIEVCNLGTAEKTIRELRGWNSQFPNGSRQSSGSEAVIRVKQLTGELSLSGYGRYGCGGRPTHTPIALRPGETYRKTVTSDISELRAGEHEIDVVLLGRIHDTSEDVVSNALRFTVEKD